MINESDKMLWIFIPLPVQAMLIIKSWIDNSAPNKVSDDALAKKCEEIIENAFLTLGLVYNREKYGEIRMPELKMKLGSNGVCFPDHCFVDPPDTLTRIRNPLGQRFT